MAYENKTKSERIRDISEKLQGANMREVEMVWRIVRGMLAQKQEPENKGEATTNE